MLDGFAVSTIASYEVLIFEVDAYAYLILSLSRVLGKESEIEELNRKQSQLEAQIDELTATNQVALRAEIISPRCQAIQFL